jgi:hypothetical protein
MRRTRLARGPTAHSNSKHPTRCGGHAETRLRKPSTGETSSAGSSTNTKPQPHDRVYAPDGIKSERRFSHYECWPSVASGRVRSREVAWLQAICVPAVAAEDLKRQRTPRRPLPAGLEFRRGSFSASGAPASHLSGCSLSASKYASVRAAKKAPCLLESAGEALPQYPDHEEEEDAA